MTNRLQINAEGGCLCGAVRYRVEGAVEESGYCHCRTCQRQSGAPVVAWFAVKPAQFAYLSGAPSTFRASSRAGREFCSRCGTYLVFREDDEKETLSVNTATLDDPAVMAPEFHIHYGSKIAWFETADDLPRHDRGTG
ncbi:MAG: GFA family protein [Parvularculaceae bacterium]|nr:GFA family protein [Parvularculaceae bacterium]